MKLKNVKIGERVKLKYNYVDLEKGTTGTIIENDVDEPYVSWDKYTKGHDGISCRQTRIDLGLSGKSVWAAPIVYLKLVKEE